MQHEGGAADEKLAEVDREAKVESEAGGIHWHGRGPAPGYLERSVRRSDRGAKQVGAVAVGYKCCWRRERDREAGRRRKREGSARPFECIPA